MFRIYIYNYINIVYKEYKIFFSVNLNSVTESKTLNKLERISYMLASKITTSASL